MDVEDKLSEQKLPEKTVTQITDYFATATPPQREALVSLFGKQGFLPLSIMDEIRTFEDASNKLSIEVPKILTAFTGVAEESTIAFIKLAIICKALNEEWVPDLTNDKQNKYIPQPTMVAGVLNYSAITYTTKSTTVPVGLMLKSGELTSYLCTQFTELLNQYYLNLSF